MKFSLVDRTNIATAHPTIVQSIRKGWAIAIDCEFSGLALEDGSTRDQNLEMRYSALKKLVETHAIVSFGICIVNRNEDGSSFWAENFEFTVLCQQSFICSPSSLTFLRQNGFDFNALIDRGIPMSRNAGGGKELSEENQLVCNIFEEIIRASTERSVPVLVHNGLLDLMFIYSSFYGPLPAVLETFLADLSEIVRVNSLYY
jgi:target of EGR1 protein 1